MFSNQWLPSNPLFRTQETFSRDHFRNSKTRAFSPIPRHIFRFFKQQHDEPTDSLLTPRAMSVWRGPPVFLSCLVHLQRTPRLQPSMPPRVSGHHRIRTSSPMPFSPEQFRLRWLRPILTGEFARSFVLFQKGLFSLPVSFSVVPAVLFNGFRLQFVPEGLDHCVQHNLPLWAEGEVMCFLRGHL